MYIISEYTYTNPQRRKWQPIPVFLPGKSHGQRSLKGYSPWGHKESDTTEQLNNKDIYKCTYTHVYVHIHMYKCTYTYTNVTTYTKQQHTYIINE